MLITLLAVLPWQACGPSFPIAKQDSITSLNSLLPTSPGGNGDIYSGVRSLKSLATSYYRNSEPLPPNATDEFYRFTKAPSCSASSNSYDHSGLLRFLQGQWHLQANSCQPSDQIVDSVFMTTYNPSVASWQGQIFGRSEKRDDLFTSAYPWVWCRSKEKNSDGIDIVLGEKIVDASPAGDGSISLQFPSERPFGNLVQFLRDEKVPTATFVNAHGEIELAAAGSPRYDYHPSSGDVLGLLLEEARTNYAIQSSQFEHWKKDSIVQIVKDQVRSPDQSLTADFISVANNGKGFIDLPFSSNLELGDYTFSVFAKSRSAKSLSILFQSVNDQAQADYNLDNGGILSESGSAEADVDIYPGWKRLKLSFKVSSLNAAQVRLQITHNFSDQLYLWGAQLEKGSFATSYIPTASVPVQRSADLIQASSNFFDSGLGSFSLRFIPLSSKATGTVLQFVNSKSGENWSAEVSSAKRELSLKAERSLTSAQQVSLGSLMGYSDLRLSVGLQKNILSSAMFGSLRLSQSSTTVSNSFDKVLFARNQSGENLSGHLRRFMYWNRPLSEGTLVYESGAGVPLPVQGQINWAQPVTTPGGLQAFQKRQVYNFEIQRNSSKSSLNFTAPDYEFLLNISNSINPLTKEYDARMSVLIDNQPLQADMTCFIEAENLR